jgi:hypothetical protein
VTRRQPAGSEIVISPAVFNVTETRRNQLDKVHGFAEIARMFPLTTPQAEDHRMFGTRGASVKGAVVA